MAITELVFPTSGTPTVPTDYAYQNGYLAQNAKGYNAVSLTNWDATTTAPQVASGSAIEINGATWQVDADTTILTTAATSGINYLVFDDDAGAFGWDDGTPVWSATLNGWYVAGDRWTGHRCTWNGASAYTAKMTNTSNTQLSDDLFNDVTGVYVDVLTSDWAGTTGSWTTDSVTYYVIPEGVYMLLATGSLYFEMYDGSTWQTTTATSPTGLYASDGINYRFIAASGSRTIYYRRIW